MTLKRVTIATAAPPAIIVPPAAAGVPAASAAWPATNRALVARFQLPAATTLRYVNWIVGTSSGNVQVGVLQFTGTGHTTYTRVMNSGTFACPAAGDIHTDLGATALPAGDYGAFLWADNTTFQTRTYASVGLSHQRTVTQLSSLAGGVPASGTVNWVGTTQGVVLNVEADL